MQGGVIQGLYIQNQDHSEIAALVLATGGGVNWDWLFHKLGGRVFQQLQGVVSHGTQQILG